MDSKYITHNNTASGPFDGTVTFAVTIDGITRNIDFDILHGTMGVNSWAFAGRNGRGKYTRRVTASAELIDGQWVFNGDASNGRGKATITAFRDLVALDD